MKRKAEGKEASTGCVKEQVTPVTNGLPPLGSSGSLCRAGPGDRQRGWVCSHPSSAPARWGGAHAAGGMQRDQGLP